MFEELCKLWTCSICMRQKQAESDCLMQRYFGTAIGKGRQAAKTEVERLKLGEISCEQGVTEIAKMCVHKPFLLLGLGYDPSCTHLKSS